MNYFLIRINIWCIKNFDNYYRIICILNIYLYVLINKDKLKNEKKYIYLVLVGIIFNCFFIC